MDSKRRYFDEIAGAWDEQAKASLLRLFEELPRFHVAAGERVLDVGCGTGNLTARLLELVGDRGQVVAVDLSLRMIGRARVKARGGRVVWAECDALVAPFRCESFDRVFCYSVWPHFEDPRGAAREIWRLLKIGGKLHIWHSIPRASVNEIHRSAGPAVCLDHLPPAVEIESVLRRVGFGIESSRDDDTGFLVSGSKEEMDRS